MVVCGLMSKSGITMDSPPILIVTGGPDFGLSVTETPRLFFDFLLGSMFILGRLRIVLTASLLSSSDVRDSDVSRSVSKSAKE